jgi:hypothetical protein
MGIIPGISKHLFQLFVGQFFDPTQKFGIVRWFVISNVGFHINNRSSWHLLLLTKFRRPPRVERPGIADAVAARCLQSEPLGLDTIPSLSSVWTMVMAH